MVVVTAILALMAALILPNLVTINRSRALRDEEAAILRLPIQARNMAMRSGQPVILRVDGSDALVLERVSWSETVPAPTTPDSVGGGNASNTPDPMASQDAQSPQDPEDPQQVQPVTRLTLDPDVQVSSVQRNGQAMDASTWHWIAYPDGSSDAASITFQIGGSSRTLWIPAVNPDGSGSGSGSGSGNAAVADGGGGGPQWLSGDTPPDTSNDSWAAGSLEQRNASPSSGGGAQGAQGG